MSDKSFKNLCSVQHVSKFYFLEFNDKNICGEVQTLIKILLMVVSVQI